MKIPLLPIHEIPARRKARKDTELRQFIADDLESYERMKTKWVRETAGTALDEILRAGNPPRYVTQIDGSTSGSGKTIAGSGFRGGSIEQATSAVRVQWVGTDLAGIANNARGTLLKVIAETFPKSKTGALKQRWSWWVEQDANVSTGPKRPARRIGAIVPPSVGLYDVLWLAPDGPNPASYAWIANRNAIRSGGHVYNLRQRNSKKFGAKAGFTLRKRLKGYLAESTSRMRRGRSNLGAYRMGGVVIQGWFVRKTLTGPQARTRYGVVWERGVPVVRLAYAKGLLDFTA